MAKRIEEKDLFKGDVFENFVKGAELAIKELNRLDDSVKKLSSTVEKSIKENPFESFEDIQKFEKDVKSLNKAFEESVKVDKERQKIKNDLNKVDKDREKLQKQLNDLQDDNVKGKLALQKANKAQRDTLRALLVLEDEQSGTLERLAAQNTLLRLERQKLNLETEEGLQRNREINEELDKNNRFIKENSDALKQQRLNVGNYADSIRKALKPLEQQRKELIANIELLEKQGNLSTEAAKELDDYRKELDDVNASLREYGVETEDATQDTEDFGDAIGDLDGPVGTAIRGIRNLFTTLARNPIVAILGALAGLGAAFSRTEEGSEDTRVAFAKLQAVITVFVGSIGDAVGGVVNFFDALGSGNFFAASRAIEQASGAFDNFSGRIAEATENAAKLEEDTIGFEKAIRPLNEALAQTNKEFERQNAIADDATRSFAIRESAAERARRAAIEAGRIELEIAQTRLDFANREIELAGNTVSVEQRNAQSEAVVGVIEAERELQQTLIDNEKQRRELVQDRLERDLDILIDGFDNQKTVNERRIADERATLDERGRIFEETTALADDSFARQIETIQKFTKDRIDAESLVQEADAVTLNQRIRSLGLSEIIEGRLLEVVRERRLALQDLADIERDLTNQREEEAERIAELELETIENRFDRERIIRQNEFDATLEELKRNSTITAEERLALERKLLAQLKQLNDEARAEEAKEEIEFQRRLSVALLEQERANFEDQKDFEEFKQEELRKIQIQAIEERLDAIADLQGKEFELEREELKAQLAALNAEITDANREALQQRVQDTADASQEIISNLQRESQERARLLQEDINNAKQREQQLVELAAAGSRDALENLAFEQQRRAELEAERREEIRRQQRLELASAAINTFNSKIQQGDDNAVTNTVRDLLTLRQLVRAIPGFYEGTESVEKSLGKPHLQGRDGYMIRVDGKERILNPSQNQAIGNISNDELVSIVRNYQLGLKQRDVVLPVQSDMYGAKSVELLGKIYEKKPTEVIQQNWSIDAIRGVYEMEEKRKNKIDRIRGKV